MGFAQISAGLLAIGFACFVYRAAPNRPQNRILGLYFFLEGWVFGSLGAMYVSPQAPVAYAFYGINTVLAVPWLAAYLLLLGTLETPLTRLLRHPRIRIALAAGGAAGAVLFFLVPSLWTSELAPAGFVEWVFVPGAWNDEYALLALAVHVYAMIAAVSAWRRAAPRSSARSRNRAFAVAFGVRDVIIALGFGIFVTSGSGLLQVDPMVSLVVILSSIPIHMTLFVAVAGYGILKAQLFDIDLKIKWTIQRGTVAGIFVGAFIVAFAVAEQFLQEKYGWVVGGVAIGLLLIALRPIERLADRLADRAMPHVRDTAEYRIVRKREVYHATLEGALLDGAISERERGMLARLQDQLGLSATEARDIEREAAAAAGGAGAVA